MKFDTFTSTINEKKGLWDNMHARRKAGKPKRKPGDKNYPKTLNVEQTCGKGEYFCNDDQKCKPIPEGHKVKADGELVSEGAAWTRKEGKNKSGGLNEKGRKSYERANPGSDLKAPSKKKGNKRRASFCARMKGMKKKLTSAKTARDPDSRINKSLRAWNCSYEPDRGEIISETMLSAIRRKKEVLNQSQKKKPQKAMDAGARLRRKKQREEHRRYVNDIIPDHLKDEYMPIIEGKNKCGKGEYYCNDDKKCKPIPKGYRIGYGGYLKPENKEDESNGKKGGSNGNGNGHGGNGNGHGGNGNGGNGGGNGGGE